MKFQARDSLAKMFWEVNLLRLYSERGFVFTPTVRDVIAIQAEQITRSFPENFGFPPGFVIELKLLLPGVTQSCDWLGTRKRIMSHWPTDDIRQKTNRNNSR